MTEAFTWGSGGNKLSPDEVKRRRDMASALLKSGTDASPVQHWTQGAARVMQALLGGYQARKASEAEGANRAEDAKLSSALVSQLFGAGSTPSEATAVAAPAAPSMAGDGAARTMAMPNINPEIKDGIAQTASALGIAPVDLATAISYETGGTFDPTKAGPTTKWGQHRGLIQFGEPQAKQFGVDWNNPVGSQLGPNGAVAAYLKNAGVQPGMGLLDIYSAINAGAPGLYNRSDAAAGGAPGTVRDKVERQMAGHRAKAQALFGNADMPAPGASPVAMETGAPGFVIPGQAAPMDARTFNAISGGEAVQPVFQSEGVSQPWMGTALQPAQPEMVAAPMPPARPAGLALAQADMPAPGAVPAIGQMPPAMVEDLSNSPDAGSRTFAASQAQGASPFSGIAQALMGGGQTQTASAPTVAQPQNVAPAASPAVAQVAQAMSQQPNEVLSQALASGNPAIQRIASAVIANRLEQQQGSRGVVMGDRLVDPRNGRVLADFTGANGGRSSQYGLQPIYGVGPDGKPVIMQIGPRGDAVATKLPEGVSLARDPIRVDGPTGTTLLDPQSRQQVGFIPKDIAGAERAKVEGKAAGEAGTGLGQALATAEQTLTTIDKIRTHPGRSQWGATGASADWPIIGQGLGGSRGRDFVNLVEQLKGKSFLEAFESLKGGGQITETEGAKATQALARLDRAQSKEGFDEALKDLEDVIQSGMARARQKAGQAAPSSAAPSAGGWNEVAPGVRIREKR